MESEETKGLVAEDPETEDVAYVKGRALVDIPALGLRSGDYATILETEFAAYADSSNFDSAAVEPTVEL